MQPLLYANLSKKTLTETQSGSSISWPRLVAGEDLVLKLRLVQSLDGQVIAARRTISTLKASIGEKDARPLDGSFQIKLGAAPENADVNTTAKITYNATADQFAAALNALSDGALAAMQPFTCTARDGSYLVRAANGAQVMFTVTDNELWPVSFVTIREFSYDEGHSYEFRLTQAPVAETTSFNSIVPEIPSITTIQTGSENSGVKINEIQRLFVPPENPENFSFRLTFGFKKSDPIVLPTTAEEILAALAPLADAAAGEEFRVYPGQDAVLIEFTGDGWAGSNQAQLGVQVVDEAPADPTFTISTATAEMAIRARRPDSLGEIKLPMELTLGLEDEQDELTIRTIKFRGDLVFLPPVNQSAFSAAAALNWNQPLSRESYLQFSPSQVATGQRHYLITSLGDGLSDEIEVNHNLNTRYLLVQLQQAAVDGLFLTHGTDYQVRIVSNNAITLIFPGGAPAAASLIGQISTASHDANFEPHTHTIAEIDGLEQRLTALEEVVETLQQLIPIGALASNEAAVRNSKIEFATLPSIYEAFPSRTAIQSAATTPDLITSAGGTTTEQTSTTSGPATTQISSLTELDTGLLPADGGLLPAVLDARVEALPSPLPAASAACKGRVFLLGGSADLILPGGGGRKSTTLKPGQHAACDGRYWYRVTRQAETEPNWYPWDFERELFVIAVTDKDLSLKRQIEVHLGFEAAVMTRRGLTMAEYQRTMHKNTRCQWNLLFEWGTFAAEAAAAGTGFTADAGTDKITADLENCPDGTPVKLTTSGTLPGGLTSATLYTRDTAGTERRVATTPGGPAIDITSAGSGMHTITPQTASLNLKRVEWHAVPMLSHVFQFTRTPVGRSYGVRIKRALAAGADTLSAEQVVMGNTSAAGSAPASASFALRARLARFDIEDEVADPRALVVLLGLNREVIKGGADVGKAILKSA